MPCQCCGQRLPGEPTLAESKRIANEIKRIRNYHQNHALAMGLRAEGATETDIARIRSLDRGDGLWARRRLRGVKHGDYAPGMVQRWGTHIVITE